MDNVRTFACKPLPPTAVSSWLGNETDLVSGRSYQIMKFSVKTLKTGKPNHSVVRANRASPGAVQAAEERRWLFEFNP